LSHCRWNVLPPLEETGASGDRGYLPLLAQLLANRGLTGPEERRAFLGCDASLLRDPLRLPDMEQAAGRLYRALLAGEKVCVYGDYDADGITAAAVLVEGLTALGGNAVPYIPHRQTEGHGLQTGALRRLREDGVSLVVTVDCGVTDVTEVKKAVRLGMDVVVTDHHSPLDVLPEAVAVVDAKLPASRYGFTGLAGCGVAYKLLHALLNMVGREELLDDVVDLVAIGTVADMSPALGENRYLITRGLERINSEPRPGLRELMNVTGCEAGSITADRIGWVLAPCLNAAGRLADGLTGFNLLATRDDKEAKELAAWLARKNEERQRLTTAALARAREAVQAAGLPPLLMTASHEYPMGVAGLVAGRLTEEFYRPAIVVHTAGTISHGSCRSIPEFDVIAALNRFDALMTRYGGHAAAAGFTLPTAKLPALQEGLSKLAAGQLAGVELLPRLDIDARLTLPELAGDTWEQTRRLAPFGVGNAVPTFLSETVEVLERRTMGANGDHLRFRLRQSGAVWTAVAFRLGRHAGADAPLLDIVYNLEEDNWNGRRRLRLNILDFKPAG
jgi:single-stranded-DNA-specific exonuclease